MQALQPVLQAWLSVLTEIAAGALLVLGLLTSFAAAAVISVMLVAGLLAHRTNGFFVFKEGYEYVLVLGVVALSVVTFAAAPPGGDYPDAIARLFADFSIGSRNTEHARAVAALNDRLHAIRRAEAQLLPDWQEELAELSRHLGEGARAALAGIAGYHRRRIKLASEIVRYRYRLD